jgi:hypothetical protein
MGDEREQPTTAPLHAIRLRGAWAVTSADGRDHHTRRFGWPTALDPHERVWLVCAALPKAGCVVLNGAPVGAVTAAGGPFAADITDHLTPRNELTIRVPVGTQPGEVALEVRPAGSAAG